MKKVWETRMQCHQEAYRLNGLRWVETRERFFKQEMNLNALNYRACRSYALQAESQQEQPQSRALASQGH